MNPLVREIERDAAEKAAAEAALSATQTIARQMLKMGFTPQQIAEATKLSLEQIAALPHSSPS